MNEKDTVYNGKLVLDKDKFTWTERLFFRMNYLNAKFNPEILNPIEYTETIIEGYRANQLKKVMKQQRKKLMKTKQGRARIEKYEQLFPAPNEKIDIDKMNSQEFYDYLLTYESAEQSFLDFLFDFITTAYLEGDLNEDDITNIVKAPSIKEIKKYLDQSVNNIKYHYTMAEEILRYEAKDNGSELLAELAPNKDKKKQKDKDKYKIKTIDNLKKLLKDNSTNMEDMRKSLEKAKMVKAERERVEKHQKSILATVPEALDLVKRPDSYDSDAIQKRAKKKVVQKEAQKEEKQKVIIRKAPPRKLTPSELIAEKKRLLNKAKNSSSLDIKT